MRRFPATLGLLLAVVAFAPAARAQFTDPASQRPGRDPKQPIDEAYTKKIKEYTTETFFLSPLVDYIDRKSVV